MNWETLVAVVLGGLITIAAQEVQAWRADRREVRRRSDQATEAARALALRISSLDRRFPQQDQLTVSGELERHMDEELLPELRREIGYMADSKVRDQMTLMANSLDRWLDLAQAGGDLPRTARWTIGRYMDELLSAYRRHDSLPKEPKWLRKYQLALDEGASWHDEEYRLEQEEREAEQP